MIKVAIIGFGGIAQTAHMPAYRKLEQEGKIKLIAVCDVDPTRFEKKMEINIGGGEEQLLSAEVRRYTDWQEMLEQETPDIVDICVPTFLHAEVAIGVLQRGFHVLSEKPMSLTYADCQEMCEAARIAGKRLMVGQCLRFGNEYAFLKQALADGRFGRVLSAGFRRLSGPPIWGWDNWFMDYERSHGCVLDMHIHDIDMARYLFGDPEEVSCDTQDVYSGRDIVHSRLYYPGFAVQVTGDWSQEGLPFTADYRVAFEKATVDYAGGVLTVYPRGGEAYTPEWEPNNFYEGEIRYFADLLAGDDDNTLNPPESAARTVRLIEVLIDSADHRGDKRPFAE